MSKPYFLPEWHAVDSVLIAWPFPGSDWDYCIDDADSCYQALLRALSLKVKVKVLIHPSVDAQLWQASFALALDWTNIEIINHIEYDDTWIRDYGPLSLSTGLLNFNFDGWGKKYPFEADNAVNAKLKDKFQALWFDCDLVAEGGALDVNEQRVLLANKSCVLDSHRNPCLAPNDIESQLKDVLGLKDIWWIDDIALTGDDTDGHIDTVARFTKSNGIVYSGPNEDHPDSEALSSLDHQIKLMASREGCALFSLPTPIIYSKYSDDLLPATYANFLHCNDVIFVPVYGVESDSIALAILAKAFPDTEIMPVRCETLLEQHGSLHCATMQLHHV